MNEDVTDGEWEVYWAARTRPLWGFDGKHWRTRCRYCADAPMVSTCDKCRALVENCECKR